MVRVIRANEILQAEASGVVSANNASNANTGNTSNASNAGSGGYDPCKDVSSQTVRFATIIVHLYRALLEKEEEVSVAVDMLYVLEIVGLFVGREFYALALPELLSIIDTALQYNVTARAQGDA